MEKPDNPQLDAILASVEQLREAEPMVEAIKSRLSSEIAALATIADKKARRVSGIYAYWSAAELNANELALATVGKRSAAAMLAGFATTIDIGCERCATEIVVTSRTQMRGLWRAAQRKTYLWPEGYRVLFHDCREAIFEERDTAFEAQRAADAERRRELVAMPYAKFVRTEDWVEERTGYLHHLLLVGRELVCEICDGADALSVVHRGERAVGRYEPLALQCADCTELLHGAGKVAVLPLAENGVSRRYLDHLGRIFEEQQGRDPDQASEFGEML